MPLLERRNHAKFMYYWSTTPTKPLRSNEDRYVIGKIDAVDETSIEPSTVVVDKKDGSKRFCVDFRQLNKITKTNSWPLPLIDDLLDQLGKASYFTSLDLKSGYWQVQIQEQDKEKTTFVI